MNRRIIKDLLRLSYEQFYKIEFVPFECLVCCIDWRIRDLEDLDFGEMEGLEKSEILARG